ncbi:Protein of unknown function [Filimonas lacunae]|uniref:Lysozyme inhibitor LprI-like N-terminal domain-containing protein n=1 Tax=Filimonas lacunae TaxID=477680 RepID=A0A173MJ33_9BACT|nr:lysozyme inhibitor LprI family protein [Filimonas lacunae]BAV07624.1 hypothetical protein FLA_3650 [Filimonas lacunae]SIT29753.1 Protein of unknown function [Filimonas lacunae]
MHTVKPLLLCLAVLLFTSALKGQQVVDSLDKVYQARLDEGVNMVGTAHWYYNQMDSLLNVYYKKLRAGCDSVQKENLKDEQVVWLSKRDTYFKKTEQNRGKNGGGRDGEMIMMDEKASFVQERVVQLSHAQYSQYTPVNYKVEFTGNYSIKGTVFKNGEQQGKSGSLAVKKIGADKVMFHLSLGTGAPRYHTGTCYGTISVKDNKALYNIIEDDGYVICRIRFYFFRQGIKVVQETEECDFGTGVFANGYYFKTSDKTPTQEELTSEM